MLLHLLLQTGMSHNIYVLQVWPDKCHKQLFHQLTIEVIECSADKSKDLISFTHCLPHEMMLSSCYWSRLLLSLSLLLRVVTLRSSLFLSPPMCMNLHFSALKCNCHFCSHFTNCSYYLIAQMSASLYLQISFSQPQHIVTFVNLVIDMVQKLQFLSIRAPRSRIVCSLPNKLTILLYHVVCTICFSWTQCGSAH